MIAYNVNQLCKEAEVYLYDFLFEESKPVPPNILEHLNQCPYCSAKINRLDDVVSHVDESVTEEQRQEILTNISWLKLHFRYIGQPVNCGIVKPFLPGILNPFLQIKIPTPITVHLDKCKTCNEDLEKIRRYNLNHKQLMVLGKLYAAKLGDNGIACTDAESAVDAIVGMNFGKTTKQALEHVCLCPDCHTLVHNYRDAAQKYLTVKNSTASQDFPCEKVYSKDFFDYIVPFSLDPKNDQYVNFRSFFTSHIKTCPTCIGRMQQMHSELYGIADRAESGVVTTYHIEQPTSLPTAAENTNKPYEGFPISVEANIPKEEVYAKTVLGNKHNRIVPSKINMRPFAKIGFAAAAVFLIGSALMLNISSAKAVSLEGIYKVLGNIRNIHIKTFASGQTKNIQEQWVSKTLNINIVKNNNELVLWDIPNKVKKIKNSDNGQVETKIMTADMIPTIQRTIDGSWGLLPFNSITEVPADAQWNRVDENGGQNLEAYELTWSEESYGSSKIYLKWHVLVDINSGLPKEVKWYRKLQTDNNYILLSSVTAEYLDDVAVQNLIGTFAF
jgi:hypothetical protein